MIRVPVSAARPLCSLPFTVLCLLGLVAGSLGLMGNATASEPIAKAAERPNVIFFLSDDQRADFMGCAGHPVLKTPTLDRLAGDGVRFANGYVTTSICAASRATLLTGRYERNHGYTFGKSPIRTELVHDSYPARLRAAGYRTGFVGKFGVRADAPGHGGMFDSFVRHSPGQYFKKGPDGERWHVSDVIGHDARAFLRETKEQDDGPFCLSVSFVSPHAKDSDKENHYPYPETESKLYKDAVIAPPLIETDYWKTLPEFFHNAMHRTRFHWRWDTQEKYERNVRSYYRMLTGIDRVMGEVLDELKALGYADNTIVIFMGDNGYYKGSRGFAGKWSHFHESMRVPLIVHDPRLPKNLRGRVVTQMGLNVDVPATIVDYGTGSVPDGYQGASLKPILEGKPTTDWRTDFFGEHLMDRFDIPKWEGVRGERYVYARYFENLPEGEFLHDTQTDPLEKTNLADDPEYADVLKTMRKRCDELREQWADKEEK